MKLKYLFLFFCIGNITLYAQSNTEVFLFDIEKSNSKIELKNAKNISNNEGYDNQPSFLDERYIVFSSNRKGQTDIAKYDTRYGSKLWLNHSEGGEYTPLKVPNKNAVSAVRLDKDGKQRLYSYNQRNGESEALIKDLVVAYYTWYDESTIVSCVIENETLNLYVSNLKTGENKKYADNVGRSFHRIPNSNLVSFVSKENNKQWQIKSLNPKTGIIKTIANTMEGVEDICWLNSKTILTGKEQNLYTLTLRRDKTWKKVADLSDVGIKKITRLIANTDETKLLIAADIGAIKKDDTKTDDTPKSDAISKAEAVVQTQLDAYNKRNIDAFVATYSDAIKVYNYPNTLLYEGKSKLKERYAGFFERTKDLNAAIKSRIVIGNKVIDEEQVTVNGESFHAVAIYEVENGKIYKVTFIQ